MSRFPALSLLLGVLVACGSGSGSDPVRILERADAATRSVDAVAYRAEFSLTGDWPGVPRDVRGTAVAQRATGSDAGAPDVLPRQRIEARFASPGAASEEHQLAASDGRNTILIDYSGERFWRADREKLAAAMGRLQVLHMPEYVAPDPFGAEIEAHTLVYEGLQEVGGVECDVVYVEYDPGSGSQKTRWYFGRRDSLPRRVDRIQDDGTYTLAISELEVDPDLADDTFHPVPPEGFRDLAKPAAVDG